MLSTGVSLWRWDTGGAGDVVVLAHPASGNHASWGYQQPVLAAAGYRVIGYSRRGYYGSERGPDDDHGTQAGDLAALLDVLEIDRAHVLGSAAGGSTALDFALMHPARTRSAIIASSLMSVQEPDYKAASARARGPWFDGLPVDARELSPGYRSTCPAGAAAWQDIHDLNPHDALRQPVAASITWDSLAAMTTPSLLLTGDADLYMPPAVLKSIAARMPRAECLIAEEAGHPVFWEQPDWFNSAMLDFLVRNPG
jgi:pimeloyl-ACP methyl ester carboxylesterase